MNRNNSNAARRNYGSNHESPSSGNRNRYDRRDQINVPRSLLRDRPLAEPRRHHHTPLVVMNVDRTGQQRPLVTAGESTTVPSTRNRSFSNETTMPQPNPSIPLTPSPSSPISDQSSSPSSSFLPSIDEGSSEFNKRLNKKINYHERKLSSSYNSGSGGSLASQVPSLSAASDSSVDSCLEVSLHSTDSSSDSSIDFEYESYDDSISVSCRSTQSMPLAGVSGRRSSSGTRRRSDKSKRPLPTIPTKQSRYARSSSAPYSSNNSLPSLCTPARMPIPAPPFAKQARRQSYPPITQTYPISPKTKPSSPSDYDPKIGMKRRQCLSNFLRSGVCLQLLLLLGIGFLFVWSRSQATFATDTLLRLKEAESMSLLKLHRLETHSMHVHDLMRKRLLKENGRSKDTDDLEDLLDGEYPEEVIDPEDDPLSDQYQELTQMSHDLRKHADVTTLQGTIQETAIEEIVSTFGEGPVKVVVELDFGDRPIIAHKNNRQAKHTHDMVKGTYISIILWPDTPHAAWAWLEQIRRSVWNRSTVKLNPASTLLSFHPTKDDPKDRGHLEFVEGHPRQENSNSDMHHGAWTIGLRETVGDDHKKGRLEMFINLADNQTERKHETCVGKIFDGFDALQRLLEGTEVTPDGDANMNVSVKSVSAMHMTHSELQQIYR